MSNYPNVKWSLFEAYNDNVTDRFESLCWHLFTEEFVEEHTIPHRNHNNKGIEVMPVVQSHRISDKSPKRISYQAKYTNSTTSAYSKFIESAKVTAANYKGKLDLVYLFSNQTLTTESKSYKKIVKLHKEAGIETYPISNQDLLNMIEKYGHLYLGSIG